MPNSLGTPVPETELPLPAIVRLKDEECLESVLEIDTESFVNSLMREMYVRELGRRETCHLYVLRTTADRVASFYAF
jgi:hypothetical protein